MLHESLAEYSERVERLVLQLSNFYVDHYTQEVVSYQRLNVRFRLRTSLGHLLEVSEALGLESDELTFLHYRYHFQDPHNQMIFRYDSAPHHRHLPSFPDHKHVADAVIASARPSLDQVVREVMDTMDE